MLASARPIAEPQTNQRRLRFASQLSPKPPSARPDATMPTTPIHPAACRCRPCRDRSWRRRSAPGTANAVHAARRQADADQYMHHGALEAREAHDIPHGRRFAASCIGRIERAARSLAHVEETSSARTAAGMARPWNHQRQSVFCATHPPMLAPAKRQRAHRSDHGHRLGAALRRISGRRSARRRAAPVKPSHRAARRAGRAGFWARSSWRASRER